MQHYPNFNMLRLLAASSVVFSHSFLIATGSEVTEPMHSTGFVTGVYGVFVFFILSGFLVTESAKRSANVFDFCRKRFLRIAPAFVFSTFVITYLVCPLFASNGVAAFVLDSEVLNIALKTVFLHTDQLYFDTVQFYPPSAGAEWLPQNTNAVLWTIRLEILGYAFIALLMSISLLKPDRQALTVVIVVVLAALSVAYLPNMNVKWISQLMFVFPSLCCGIFMNWLVRFHRPRADIAFISTVGLALAALYDVLPSVFCFLVAYPLIWMGSVSFSPFRWFSSETDLSYGIYLYGWPVTQLIRAAVGDGLSGYELTALALPATAIVAYLSWHLIEKPALAFKAAKAEIVPT